MPIGCVLFLFYYLCSEFLEIILKEMRGIGNHIQVFYAISPAASCGCSVSCEGGNNSGRAYPYCHFL